MASELAVLDFADGEPEAPVRHRTTVAEAMRRREFECEALLHLDALLSFALKLSRSRDDAEDLVSETMLRALERWEQYRLGTNIRAWLFTIPVSATVAFLLVRLLKLAGQM